jgi:hypothetical protein
MPLTRYTRLGCLACALLFVVAVTIGSRLA